MTKLKFKGWNDPDADIIGGLLAANHTKRLDKLLITSPQFLSLCINKDIVIRAGNPTDPPSFVHGDDNAIIFRAIPWLKFQLWDIPAEIELPPEEENTAQLVTEGVS